MYITLAGPVTSVKVLPVALACSSVAVPRATLMLLSTSSAHTERLKSCRQQRQTTDLVPGVQRLQQALFSGTHGVSAKKENLGQADSETTKCDTHAQSCCCHHVCCSAFGRHRT